GMCDSYHSVSVGLFMEPPAPSFSVFVPAHGFPLPVYATNESDQFAPIGTIVFWDQLGLNFLLSGLLSSTVVGASILLSAAISKSKKTPNQPPQRTATSRRL